MKVSIVLASLADRYSVTSKSFTSPAIWALNGEGSKRVMRPIPERPLTRLSHAVSISLPTGETIPRPVMTTRRFTDDSEIKKSGSKRQTHRVANPLGGCPTPGLPLGNRLAESAAHSQRAPTSNVVLLLAVRGDVVDSRVNRRELLGFFVRNVSFEFIFDCHHQLDHIERSGTEVVKKRRFVLDLGFVDAKLFSDDLLDALFDAFHADLQVGKIPANYSQTTIVWVLAVRKNGLGDSTLP